MLQAWGRQAVCALANLHQNCLIHQNIHPGAICLDDGGRVVLDDFLFMLDARERHCGYSHGRSDYGTISRISLHRRFYNHIAQSPQKRCLGLWLLPLSVAYRCSAICAFRTLPSILEKIPRRFIGPMYSAISLALQPCPPARADANDLVRILSANL